MWLYTSMTFDIPIAVKDNTALGTLLAGFFAWIVQVGFHPRKSEVYRLPRLKNAAQMLFDEAHVIK